MGTNRHQDKWTNWLKVLVFAIVLAFALPSIYTYVRTFPLPNLDNNTQAYLLILEGSGTGEYAESMPMFDRAYSMADDPKLRYLADYSSRGCQLALKAGVSSFEEGNSLEGGIKGVIRGLISPLDGVDAGTLLFKEWFGDFKANCEYADAFYRPRALEYLNAEYARRNPFHFSWIVFFLGVCGFFVIQSEPYIRTQKGQTQSS